MCEYHYRIITNFHAFARPIYKPESAFTAFKHHLRPSPEFIQTEIKIKKLPKSIFYVYNFTQLTEHSKLSHTHPMRRQCFKRFYAYPQQCGINLFRAAVLQTRVISAIRNITVAAVKAAQRAVEYITIIRQYPVVFYEDIRLHES